MLGVPTSWVYEQSRAGRIQQWRSAATGAFAKRRLSAPGENWTTCAG
jgi:hypothetical protein